MKFLLLLLVFLPTLVFGDTYDDEWPIYVYGDASYYKLIYDGIAMIVLDEEYMKPIFEFVFGISLLLAAKNFGEENLTGALWNVAAGLGIVSMLLYPTSTVHILDVRVLNGYVEDNSADGSGYHKADHIPFYLAAVPSFASSLKYYIIDEFTDALTPIDGGSFRDSGFATPMTLAEDMISGSNFKYSSDSNYTAPKFEMALSHYIEYCIVKEVLYVDKTLSFGIMDPKGNQLDALAPSNFSDQNLEDVDIEDLHGNDTTCGDFWDDEIDDKKDDVADALYDNLKRKNPSFKIDDLAGSIASVAGLEGNASVAMTKIKEAKMNIATSGTLRKALERSGMGLSGIELSNAITSQQTLFDGMTDNTGQWRWMIKILPVVEFLVFGILIFLGLPMGVVAGLSGAQRGGKMLFNYAAGLVAFSFIDVALAILQAISLFYYKTKMAETLLMLGTRLFHTKRL